jgi:hypothetical protein
MQSDIAARRLTHLSEAVSPRRCHHPPVLPHCGAPWSRENDMAKIGLFVFIVACAGVVLTPASGVPISRLDSSLAASGLELVASKTVRSMPAPSKKKHKMEPPRTMETPYCPYGKKSDGSCWVRCKYVICL